MRDPIDGDATVFQTCYEHITRAVAAAVRVIGWGRHIGAMRRRPSASWLFATGLNALLLREMGVVVAFHRVQDGWDTQGLSIGRDLFARHCRFFKAHFRRRAARSTWWRGWNGASRSTGSSLSRSTWLPGQLRERLGRCSRIRRSPATFFVVSQWIGSDEWPWWDREQGVRHPWMTWIR